MNINILLTVFALVVLIAALGLIKVVRIFNSPDGERYRRTKMQGPFVPLSREEIEEDEQRSAGVRKS